MNIRKIAITATVVLGMSMLLAAPSEAVSGKPIAAPNDFFFICC